MSDEEKKAQPLSVPAGVEDEPKITEVLRIWMTPKGKIYASWTDALDGGKGGLGGLLGSVAQMIAVSGDKENASEMLRVVTRDFVAAAARVPSKAPEGFPKLFEYNEIVNAFHTETDRAAGILAAAWLDDYLGQCLRYFLVHDEKENEELVGSEKMMDRALSSFKTRAQALYLLGLMPKDSFRDIGFIAKIRNRFAHHPATVSFEDEKVQNWCGELQSAKQKIGDSARDNYLFTVSLVVMELNNTLMLTRPIDAIQ
jgi:DNA-binding MltR family transcriptional regulator